MNYERAVLWNNIYVCTSVERFLFWSVFCYYNKVPEKGCFVKSKEVLAPNSGVRADQ